MEINAMKSYEIGVLPESTFYSFSPSAEIKKLYYYPISCGHIYCNNDYYIKRDTYPPLLLVYVVNGIFSLKLNSKNYEAGPGQIVIFDCHDPHYYQAKEYCEFYYAHFDGPQAHEICRDINKARGVLIDNENNRVIFQALADLCHYFETDSNKSAFTTSSRIYQLFALLDDPARSPRLKTNDETIGKTIDYLRAHVGDKLTLSTLAKKSGFSVYYYSHLFKELTGFSPTDYLINARIDQAKALLVTTNLPISDIAKQVGYPNISNLVNHFTKRVGCPPTQFRKQSRSSTRESNAVRS